MGWKTINGRRYYYKSEREGGRVPEELGPTSAEGVQAKMDHQRFIDSLG
jgi:hypothetical protein